MSTVFLAPVVFFIASATRLVSLKYLDSTKNISRVSAKISGQRTLSTWFLLDLLELTQIIGRQGKRGVGEGSPLTRLNDHTFYPP